MANTKVTENVIKDSAVVTAGIADDAVTTAKIPDSAITTAKIADNSVTTAKIPDDGVTTAKIADNQVTLAKMAGLARGKIIYGDSSGNPAALAVGSNGQVLKSDGTDIAWGTDNSGVALDDISTGDAATTLATSAGNITIDAQGNDTDIIFKGTDGSSDTTFLTLDGSEAGTATFNHDIILGDNGVIGLGASNDLQIWHDASNSHISNNYGVLYIDQHTNDGNLILRCDDMSGGLAEYISLDGGAGDIYFKAISDIIHQSTSTNSTAGHHIFKSYNTEIMRIDGANNKVGIGTTSPSTKLHLEDSSADSIVQLTWKNDARDWRLGVHGGVSDSLVLYDNTASATRMVVDSSGNVGIGTASPTAKLHLEVADGAEFLKVTQTGNEAWAFKAASGSGSMDYVSVGISGGTQAMAWQEDGKVGIGTTSPDQLLTLKADGAVAYNGATDLDGESFLKLEGTSADGEAAMIRWANHGGMNNYFGVTQVGSSGQGDFVWTSYGGGAYAERMRIASAGNVGIGTDDPDTNLHVFKATAGSITNYSNNALVVENSGDVGISLLTPNANGGHLMFGSPGHQYHSYIRGGYGASTTSTLKFFTDQINTMTHKAGKVGIGTDDPSANLHLASTGDCSIIINADTDNSGEGDNPLLIFKQDGTVSHFEVGVEGSAGTAFTGSLSNTPYLETTNTNYGMQFATNGNARMMILADGNVGIGTTAPLSKLHVEGSAFIGEGSTYETEFPSSTATLHVHEIVNDATGVDFGNEAHVVISTGVNATGAQGYQGSLWFGTSDHPAGGSGSGTGGQFVWRNAGIASTSGASDTGTASGVGNLEFYTNNGSSTATERMTITSNGYVGIGLDPTGYAKLTVNGTGTLIGMRASSGAGRIGWYEGGAGRFYMESLNGADGIRFLDGDGSTEHARFTAIGSFGVGCSPRGDMHFSSGTGTSGEEWGFGGGQSNTVFYVIDEDNAGVMVSHGGSSWQSHSDERIKENIVSLGTVMPDLKNMRCVKYNRIGKTDTKIGFIAQDWESKFSEVVDEDDGFVIDSGKVVTPDDSESTTKIKSISYTETIPVLLKAIQELEARIATLEG